MKLNLLGVLFVLLTATAFSQAGLQQFNSERIKRTKDGMLILGSWAVANIAVGTIGLSTARGETRYFHQMSLIWGSVNLAIGGSALLGLRKKKSDLSLSQSMLNQTAIEKTFLINGGLDLVYLAAGWYCFEKSKNVSDSDKYRGYGKSLFLQGGGLLLFDVIMYIGHVKHGRFLYKALEKLQFSGNRVGLVWKL